MKRHLTILLDLDEIVVNMQPFWYAAHNERTGDTLSVEKVTDWDITKFTPYGKAVFDPIKEPGFYEALPPVAGAIDGVQRLIALGHKPVVCSFAPNAEAAKGKCIWIVQHMPFLPSRSIILTSAKEMVRADMLVDDCPANLIAYKAAWPSAKVATIEYPYLTNDARAVCDLVAGTWRNPAAAWDRLVRWIEERS